MRISRRRKRPEPKKEYCCNEGIKSPVVLVLANDNSNLGEMKIAEAISLAEQGGHDLLLINPKSNPPVTKIMDLGQYKYQQEKKERLAKAQQKAIETKCIRLSLRIGQNDLEMRKKQTLKFLEATNKVKVELILKGREMAHKKLGFEALEKFVKEIKAQTEIKIDQPAESQGNRITTIITK